MTSKKANILFCAGLGFTARALISQLQKTGKDWQFIGSNRSDKNQESLQGQDIKSVIFDGISKMTDISFLENITHLLISTAPTDEYSDPFLHFYKDEILKMKNLKWVGYLSTTGVYGNKNGAGVDEDTLPAPTSKRGEQRLAAEQAWQDLTIPLHIFRLSSIYGEGRGQLHSILTGRAKRIIKENQFFSRIHVADIAQILTASIEHPNAGQIYNLSDDYPCPPEEIADYLCGKLGRPLLPTVGIDDESLSPLMKSFYSESKKIENHLIKSELGIKLKYPTYKEGYQTLLDKL
jgi:nucleoside-diphosphate-sugar epimerase